MKSLENLRNRSFFIIRDIQKTVTVINKLNITFPMLKCSLPPWFRYDSFMVHPMIPNVFLHENIFVIVLETFRYFFDPPVFVVRWHSCHLFWCVVRNWQLNWVLGHGYTVKDIKKSETLGEFLWGNKKSSAMTVSSLKFKQQSWSVDKLQLRVLVLNRFFFVSHIKSMKLLSFKLFTQRNT